MLYWNTGQKYEVNEVSSKWVEPLERIPASYIIYRDESEDVCIAKTCMTGKPNYSNPAPVEIFNDHGTTFWTIDRIGQEKKTDSVQSIADTKYATRFKAPKTGSIIKIKFYGAAYEGFTVTVRTGIYSDSAGTPDSLLGSSDDLLISDTEQWWTTTYTTPVAVTAGTYYWLTVHWSTEAGIFAGRYYSTAGETNQTAYKSDTFADGLDATFGTATYENVQLAILAIYDGLDIEESDDATERKYGLNSYKMILTNSVIDIYHDYTSVQDFSTRENIKLWFYGANTGNTVRIEFYNETYANKTNGYYTTFVDNTAGWYLVETPRSAFANIGAPIGWNNILCVRLLTTVNASVTYRIDWLVNKDSDSTIIQSAMDALTSGRIWKEKVLLKGDFTISGQIKPGNYTILDLRQAKLKLASGLPSGKHLIEINNKTNVQILGGLLDGNKTGQTQLLHGILITNNSSKIKVGDVRLTDWKGFAIYVYDSSDVDILYNRIEQSDEAGIVVEAYGYDALRVNLVGNRIEDVGLIGSLNKNGIHFEGHVSPNNKFPKNGLISSNTILKARGNGITVSNTYSTRITTNHIQDCYIEGIIVLSSFDSSIVENILVNNDVGNVAGYENGVRIDDTGVSPASKNITIALNRILNHDGYAIIEKGSADYNSIKNNNIQDNLNTITVVGSNTIVIHNQGFVTENSGTTTFDGTGTQTVFDIASHGLAENPSDRTKIKCYATPQSTDAENASPVSAYPADIDADGYYEGLRIVFATAPISGIGNVVVSWYAELTS